ncbi:hypothetical protein ACFLUJ_00030 [Chloroflexota bacterium]
MDFIGALEVGITPVFIGRRNLCPEVNNCLRTHTLTELTECLQWSLTLSRHALPLESFDIPWSY